MREREVFESNWKTDHQQQNTVKFQKQLFSAGVNVIRLLNPFLILGIDKNENMCIKSLPE